MRQLGNDVKVFVLIRKSHIEFKNVDVKMVNIVTSTRANQQDDIGLGNWNILMRSLFLGTHVAAKIVGQIVGIAWKAKLISIKVLDNEGYGTWAGNIL